MLLVSRATPYTGGRTGREQRRRKTGETRRRKEQTPCCEQFGFLFELVLVCVTQELLILANKTNPLFMALIQLGYF